jgi:diguanylate cyclase (GGDEF)-like protein
LAFARLLRHSVLGSDLAARLGGDEFVVVLTRVHGPQDAVVVAERILAALRTPLCLDGHSVRIGASIGISVTTGDVEDTVATLVKRTDLAMYEAKQDAGSAWRVYVDGQPQIQVDSAPRPADADGDPPESPPPAKRRSGHRRQ